MPTSRRATIAATSANRSSSGFENLLFNRAIPTDLLGTLPATPKAVYRSKSPLSFYFAAANAVLGIVDDLRRWFARLKLRSDLLDLRALLFELRCENIYFFLLLRDR